MIIQYNTKNIEDNVKNIIEHWNIYDKDYHIDFGEDCFNIVLTGKSEIFTDMIDELKECFNNDLILVRVENGNIILVCEIVAGTPALYGEIPIFH